MHGGIHRIESLGEEGKPLAQGSHPLVGSDVSAAFPNTALAFAKSDPLLIFSPPFFAWVCSFSHSAGRPSNETRRESNQRSPTNESKGRCSHMETIATWFPIVCAMVSIITVFINMWLNG